MPPLASRQSQHSTFVNSSSTNSITGNNRQFSRSTSSAASQAPEVSSLSVVSRQADLRRRPLTPACASSGNLCNTYGSLSDHRSSAPFPTAQDSVRAESADQEEQAQRLVELVSQLTLADTPPTGNVHHVGPTVPSSTAPHRITPIRSSTLRAESSITSHRQ